MGVDDVTKGHSGYTLEEYKKMGYVLLQSKKVGPYFQKMDAGNGKVMPNELGPRLLKKKEWKAQREKRTAAPEPVAKLPKEDPKPKMRTPLFSGFSKKVLAAVFLFLLVLAVMKGVLGT